MVFSRGKKKTPDSYHKQWLEEPYVSMSLQPGLDWAAVCEPPYGVLQNEWLATQTAPFFNHLSLLMASLSSEFCTVQKCPIMSGGPKAEFHWIDEKNKKVKGLSAPQYFDYMETFIHRQLEDEAIFPTKHDVPFPRDFLPICKRIYKLLFGVFAHLYHHHFEDLDLLGEIPHLNTIFTHFIFFSNANNLIESKDYAPLAEFRTLLLNNSGKSS